jgi:hypothetical protein
MTNIHVLSVVYDDVRAALIYYEEQRAGLGAEFLDRYDAAIQQIKEHPEGWALVRVARDEGDRDVRRCQLHQFPYGVYYEVGTAEVVIVAVMHLHRDAVHWRDRL